MQDFNFTGAESGLWISNTRVSVRFPAASGGSGKFKYQLLDEGGNVLKTADAASLVKDSNGLFHLSYPGFPSGTVQKLMVRAIDSERNIEDSNEKFVTVTLPSELYPDFNGIQSCSNFPGTSGQTQLNVHWQKGGIYPNGFFGNLPNSVGKYKIYYCEKSKGTTCLEEDSLDRSSFLVTDPVSEQATLAGLSANTAYYIRVVAVSEGTSGQPETQLEERNIEFAECKTQVASSVIVFDGIDDVIIANDESGVNEATAVWSTASGGLDGYVVYYHPVPTAGSSFNYLDPNIQSSIVLNPIANLKDLVALDSFSYHAFLVKACPDLVGDPGCSGGNDGNGKFIVKKTQPEVASFAGISSSSNDPLNPSNVFLNFLPANLSNGGIFDEYRVFISDGTTEYDITDSDSSNKLGDLYPAAPITFHNLYLDNFNKNSIALTSAKLNGLAPGVIYEADVQTWVNRLAPLPISGGSIQVEYGRTDTIPVFVSNDDTTPPQIISMTATPISGTLTTNDTIVFSVIYNENLVITGSPRIGLNVGGIIKYAEMTASTINSMTFTYTVANGDNDLNGLTYENGSISLNGGKITDLSTNNANLNFEAIAPGIEFINVDTTPPDAPTNIIIAQNWLSSDAGIVQSATWTNPTSDFSFAEVGVGSAGSGIANTVPFSSASSTASHLFGDIRGSLVECAQQYEVLVRSVDFANLKSTVGVSTSTFRYDATPPSTTTVTLIGTTSNVFEANEVSWTPVTDTCVFDHYEIAIGKDDDADGFDPGDYNNVMDWSVVPGGAGTTNYQAKSGVDGMTFSLNATDNFKVSIRGVDAAGNTSVPGSSADFVVDIAGPSTPTDFAIATQWISGASPWSSPQISWTNPTDPDFDHIKVALGSGFGLEDLSALFNVGTFTSYTWSGLTSLSECNRNYPKVIAYDDVGNPSVPASDPNIWFALDNTAPVLSGDIDTSAGGEAMPDKAPLANWSAMSRTDNCNTIVRYELAIGFDNDADGFDAGDLENLFLFREVPGGNSVTNYQIQSGVDGFNFNFNAGVDYYISIRAIDAAGNISTPVTASNHFGFVLDNTRPSVTITSSVFEPTNLNPIPLTFTFDEDVTGFTSSDVVVTNGSISGFTGGPTVYTAQLVPANVGRVYVDIGVGAAQDAAGNPSNAATQWGILTMSTNPMVSKWQVGASETVTLPLVSGFTYDFYVDWGDGTPETLVSAYNDANRSHTYTNAGIYDVTLKGIAQAWRFNNGGSKNLLISVSDLGHMGWTNFYGAFYGCQNLTSVFGGNTSQVVNMTYMFANTPLADPDTSGWDTSSVTRMDHMFDNAQTANPNTTNWNVSNVTQMDHMFYRAVSANPNTASWNTGKVVYMHRMFRQATIANPDTTNWDVSKVTHFYDMFMQTNAADPNTANWDTSSAIHMHNMFQSAAVADPDTTNWDVSNVINMGGMFARAAVANPNTINWDTGNVDIMSYMFQQAPAANPNTSGWDTAQVDDMYAMFDQATVANPDTTNWDTGNVVNMAYMFRLAVAANPNTSNWDTGKVIRMDRMFDRTVVANPDTTNWDTSKVENMREMFFQAGAANPNTANWDTGEVLDMYRMFYDNDVATPNTTNWDTSKVTDMQEMFRLTELANPDTTNWSTGNVTTMHGMFRETKAANPNTTNWNTAKVTRMDYMFQNSEAANPNTANWNTGEVTRMDYMFQNADVADPVTTNWNTAKVTRMDHMFYNATDADPDTSNWNTSSVTNMRGMFRDADNADPDVSNWDTSNVTDMYTMFYRNNSANPDTTNWDIGKVTNMSLIFYQATNLTNTNYSKFLNMCSSTALLTNRTLHSAAQYLPSAAAARANLQSMGWSINDAGPQ